MAFFAIHMSASERPNLDFLGSAEPNPNRNQSHRTLTEP